MTQKVEKFSQGTEGKKSPVYKFWAAAPSAQKKDEDKKLIKTDDDNKQDLKSETIWTTISLAGGLSIWSLIIGSFLVSQAHSKYCLTELNNISFDSIGTEQVGVWDNFWRFMWLG